MQACTAAHCSTTGTEFPDTRTRKMKEGPKTECGRRDADVRGGEKSRNSSSDSNRVLVSGRRSG